MDALLRMLREGRTAADATAPLAVVTDTLQTIGGRTLFLQGMLELWNALQSQRAQAKGMVALAGSLPAAAASHLAPAGAAADLQVVSMPERGVDLLDHLMKQLVPCPSMQGPCSVAVVLDDLSELIDAHGFAQVVDFLHRLSLLPSVSCIYASLHEDTVPHHQAAALHAMCMCQAALRTVDSLLRDITLATLGHDAHGEVCFSFTKRATGRIRVEKMLYCMTAPHMLQLFKAPETVVTQAPKEKRADQDAGTAKEALLGSMRLDLNPQERAAKEKVVLPYQHRGESAAYQSGNFKEYLPVAAGGEGKLGHVMYVRDSDDQYDSDEDPDDDLDF